MRLVYGGPDKVRNLPNASQLGDSGAGFELVILWPQLPKCQAYR